MKTDLKNTLGRIDLRLSHLARKLDAAPDPERKELIEAIDRTLDYRLKLKPCPRPSEP